MKYVTVLVSFCLAISLSVGCKKNAALSELESQELLLGCIGKHFDREEEVILLEELFPVGINKKALLFKLESLNCSNTEFVVNDLENENAISMIAYCDSRSGLIYSFWFYFKFNEEEHLSKTSLNIGPYKKGKLNTNK